MLNTQVIEKQDLDPTGFLGIHHIFRTIQGEGPFAGTPAIFIRMSGCNLQCPLCDTDYTSQRLLMSPSDILRKVDELANGAIKLIVLTGGEPLRQNIEPLVTGLIVNEYYVQVETNGTLWVPGLPVEDELFHIVCSPKTPKLNLELAPHINAFKYILHADSIDPLDGLPVYALDHGAPALRVASSLWNKGVARPPEDIFGPLEDIGSIIYVQPVDTGKTHANARHTQAAIDSCLKFNYTFCLQIQKVIGME